MFQEIPLYRDTIHLHKDVFMLQFELSVFKVKRVEKYDGFI